jgi:predicted glutamine amidotransferase
MCIIAYAKTRKLTTNEFEDCYDSNKDGVGIAYKNSENKICYIKGIMNKEKALKFYKNFPNTPHVLHFRIASSGGVSRALTHPFLVSPNSPLNTKYEGDGPLLFHNGVVPMWEKLMLDYIQIHRIIPTGPISDTRCVAMALSQMEEFEKHLNALPGKWIYLTPNRILKVGHFTEEDGVEFSNFTYKKYTSTYDSKDDYWKNRRLNAYKEEDRKGPTFTIINKELWQITFQNEYGGHCWNDIGAFTKWFNIGELEKHEQSTLITENAEALIDSIYRKKIVAEFKDHYVIDSGTQPKYELINKNRCIKCATILATIPPKKETLPFSNI